MRLLTCRLTNGETRVGVRDGGRVVASGYTDMIDLLRDGEEGLQRIRSAAEGTDVLDVDRILAPIGRPGKMLFCGVNYRGHADENPDAVFPDEPFFFSKVPSAIVGPEDEIRLLSHDAQTDWEVELAIVIGRTTRNVSPSEALDHVAGYTIVNDVSARRIQFKDNQITLGKNPDSYCPMGPEIVLGDEITDPGGLVVSSSVNGERMQHSPTSDMLFDVPTIVSHLSGIMTLEPGDLVSTGTPAGVGTFQDPPRFLEPGDVVTVEVDAIGVLTNPVVAGW